MGEHFPVSTMTAEQEARRSIRKFREVFSNVENLPPSSFRENTDIATNNTTKTPFWEGDKVKVQDGEFRGHMAEVIEVYAICIIVQSDKDKSNRFSLSLMY